MYSVLKHVGGRATDEFRENDKTFYLDTFRFCGEIVAVLASLKRMSDAAVRVTLWMATRACKNIF